MGRSLCIYIDRERETHRITYYVIFEGDMRPLLERASETNPLDLLGLGQPLKTYPIWRR